MAMSDVAVVDRYYATASSFMSVGEAPLLMSRYWPDGWLLNMKEGRERESRPVGFRLLLFERLIAKVGAARRASNLIGPHRRRSSYEISLEAGITLRLNRR